ncbi:MAG: type II secretion system protein [Planctomycetota bacterium]|jgi:prepilin-type N-terminal cleavage/methylation domain-containing protein
MRKNRGFTLVELLVVIAIVALLLSILMPSLSRVRKQAKAVVCQSRLGQWGSIFSMYVEDNEGYYPGHIKTKKIGEKYLFWAFLLRPYHQNPELHCCPMATKPRRNLDGSHGPGWGLGAFQAWGILGSKYGKNQGDNGSYGMNEWLCDPPEVWAGGEPHPAESYWTNANVIKGAGNVPMHLDCATVMQYPDHDNVPPWYDGDLWWPNAGEEEMKSFCINRHDGAINGVFVDYSVRRIGLKELWTLKWNRQYNLCGPWTKCGGVERADWPQWMRRFKDY